jgi:alpha-1,6-mannosyltransferase
MSVRSPLGATPQSGAFELRTGRLGSPRRGLRSAGVSTGVLGLSGVLLSGLLISLAGANTDALLPESVRPIPSWLAGPFGSTGMSLGAIGPIAVFVLMFVSYVLAVRGAERLSARSVLMAIAALHALMLLAPPLLSTDVFSYQAYARIWALYGANPYLHGPHLIALDPVYPFIGAKWVNTPTVYGPIFTVLSYVLAPLSIAASAMAYKAIAALASLLTVTLVWNSARLRGLSPTRAVALVGLNPLVVVYGVGGGHNDLLMLALMTGGVYALLRQRGRTSGALTLIGAGVKLTAGMVLPFALASTRRIGVRSHGREIALGAGVCAAAVAVLGFASFGSGPLHLLGTLQKVQGEGDWHSLPGVVSSGLGLVTIGHIVGLCLGVVFAGVFLWLLRRVWVGELDWIDGAGWTAAALLATTGSLLPWYVAWLLPFAALGTDRRLWRAALIITGVMQGLWLTG